MNDRSDSRRIVGNLEVISSGSGASSAELGYCFLLIFACKLHANAQSSQAVRVECRVSHAWFHEATRQHSTSLDRQRAHFAEAGRTRDSERPSETRAFTGKSSASKSRYPRTTK